MKKQPEITEKTRQRFVDAFWSLIKEKPISKIAVSELTRRAGYNRSTFYEYFLDTDDLLTYLEANLLEEIKQTIFQNPPKDSSPAELFPAIFSALNEQIYLLMGPNGDSGFIAKIRTELIPLVEVYFPRLSSNLQNFDYIACFINSTLFSLLQHWHESKKDLSTEEISTILQNLLLHGLSAYLPIDQNAAGKRSEP